MRKDKGRLKMKKAVLFGAGQVGAMVSNLMGSSYRVVCFADNCEDKWGEKLFGIPVVSPAESISFKPDLVCLCVTGNERIAEMKDQLKKLGFDGIMYKSAVSEKGIDILLFDINEDSRLYDVTGSKVYAVNSLDIDINQVLPLENSMNE